MCKRYRYIILLLSCITKLYYVLLSKNHLPRQHIIGLGTKLLVTKDFVQLGILGLNNISGHNISLYIVLTLYNETFRIQN